MTKRVLIEELSRSRGITPNQAEIVVKSVFDLTGDNLAEGKPIEVCGFGSFSAAEHKAYEGRKFRIGELEFN